MRNSILTAILCMASITVINAQCPSVSFSVPDSVCAGEPFTATNTSTGTGTFQWDACTGDFSASSTPLNVQVAGLGYPQQIKAFSDNGKYYVVVANLNTNNLTRLDFGTSPANVPTVFNYGNFGGILGAPGGVDVIKENGVWYALMVNTSNERLIRIDLGANIEANIATATDLGTFALTAASRVKILDENGNKSVFVNGIGLTRVDFGSSITNAPLGSTPISSGAIFNSPGFDISYDCTLNKFIGFYASTAINAVQVIDFGSSPGSTPTFPSTFNTLPATYSVQLVRDGADWYLMAMASGGGKIQKYKIGNNLLNTPVLVGTDSTGIANPQSLSFMQDSSRFYGFMSTIFGSTLSSVQWPAGCNPAAAYSTDPGSFTVTAGSGGYQHLTLQMTDASGYTNWYTDSVFVNPLPSSNFGFGTACEGSLTSFYDSTTVSVGTVATWSWDFGDGSPSSTLQNPAHLYTSAGTFNVSLTTQTSPSCPTDTYTASVTINPVPAGAFNFISPDCEGYQVPFTDASVASGGTSIQSWNWDFGDGLPGDSVQNPVHKYITAGVFPVQLIVATNAGCIDTVIQNITINPTPVAGFMVTSTCVGQTASFTNTTTIQGGGSITYNWDFGDTNTSTAISPVNQYPSTAANYNVTLIATSSTGCKDTVITDIRIANKPVPQFSWTPQVVCQGNSVSFINTSSGTGGDTISSYLWDFGDLNSSTDMNPVHAYADTGYYDVTLIVTSPTSCDSSLTQQVYVIPSPVITFSVANVCLNNTSIFNPLVVTPPGTVVDSLVWTFGDGNGFSGLGSPTHTYNAPGTYEVTVTVYNDLLCTDSYSDSVTVYPLPVAGFTTSLVCSGASTTFNGTTSNVSSGAITGWLWNFDGLGTATDSVALFTFPNAGNYNVTLIATTNFGCSDTITSPVNVIQSPDFTMTFNEPCLGNPANFTYNSNIIPVPPSNLLWSFGDGTLSSLLDPSHIYGLSDTFQVSLQVINPATGCAATVVDELFIKPLPVPGFTVTGSCEGLPFQLNDASVIQSGSIVSWNWDFGSLGGSMLQDPVVVPPVAGIQQLTLSVTSNLGCSSAIAGNFVVYANPVAAFIPDPLFGSPPLPVNFINNTTGGNTYLWNFGDGTTSALQSPSHTYSDTGTYVVTLTATSIQGCVDSVNGMLAVLIPYLDVAVSNVFASLDQGRLNLSAQVTNMGNIVINSFQIKSSIANGSVISEIFSGSLAPGQTIIYNFQSGYELSDTYSVEYYCVEATNPNSGVDENPSNNKKCSVLDNSFDIFTVFPNPFTDDLTINFNLHTEGPFHVEMYDETGRIVLRNDPVNGKKGFNSYRVNTTAFSKGFYVVVIRFRDDVRMYRAVKVVN